MDFNISTYLSFLEALKNQNYEFQTFESFLKNPKEKVVILRHDVDLKPLNSLFFARIQAERNIKGTYYFRAVKQSWNENIIREIHDLGHEVGYHYECLTTTKGDYQKAINDFKINLDKLRELVPVQTICMHGSPLSKFDSKDLWGKYDYREMKLIGEPYFDLNFSNVLYLTDTGRTWNNKKISVRDHVNKNYQFQFNNTKDIIRTAEERKLPKQIMFNFHPQRWTDKKLEWIKELLFQNIKNQLKKIIVKN